MFGFGKRKDAKIVDLGMNVFPTGVEVHFRSPQPIAVLGCGGLLRYATKGDEMSAAVRFFEFEKKRIEYGDVIVECVNSCPAFNKCPLVDRLMNKGWAKVKFDPIVRGTPPDDMHVPSAVIDDSGVERDSGESVSVCVKALVICHDHHDHFVTSPVSTVEMPCEEGGCASGNGRKPRENGCKDFCGIHDAHYSISPCEADAILRELRGEIHSEMFKRTVTRLVENARAKRKA